jgi:hypothetical protein
MSTMLMQRSKWVRLAVLLLLPGITGFASSPRAITGTPGRGLTPGCGWVQVRAPTVDGSLPAVATVSRRQAWAVGFRFHPDFTPYVLHFYGSTWSEFPVQPKVGRLDAVAVVTPTDIWAVGEGDGVPLAVHFDGNAWTEVPTPSRGIDSYFLGVAAPASNDVWAVGDWEDKNISLHPLMEHWDGLVWRMVPVRHNVFLETVSASSSSDVWAAGTGFLHFNGSEWSRVPGPSMDGDLYSVQAVNAIAPRLAWAVGDRPGLGGPASDRPLALRWDGLHWNTERTPRVSARLLDIATDRGRPPIAVGYSTEYPSRTIVVQRRGRAFLRVESENRPQSLGSVLGGVSIDPGSGAAWAVGSSIASNGKLRPLIEERSCGPQPGSLAPPLGDCCGAEEVVPRSVEQRRWSPI